MPVYSFETYGELQPWVGREWLQANGTGGFAASTVVGANTRRYHGLLVGATLPPVGRIVALSRVNETILRSTHSPIETGVSYFRDAIIPRGERFLRRFQHFITTRWEYEEGGAKLSKELLLCWERNVVAIRYQIDPGDSGPLELRLQPFVALRDYHSLLRWDNSFDVRPEDKGCVVQRWGNELHLRCDGMTFTENRDWWYNFSYPCEIERGQDDIEDLFSPGSFSLNVESPTTLTFWAGLEPVDKFNWDSELSRREQHTHGLDAPTRTQQRLNRAAGDFVVKRVREDDAAGQTIMAGYPWFVDGGRESMISLPGLLLSTGRYDVAGRVLCLFAKFLSEGMIPHVFDDYSDRAYYNSVDASLWFIHAAFEYLRTSKDSDTFDSILRPCCQEIIAGYTRGTRFGIKVDDRDGLLAQGDPTTQLTWMDAKTNGVVFSPRHGKAVEVNALWYHVLRLMGENDQADRVAESFRRTFWMGGYRGLADVDNETGRQDIVRPNQIFAVSLAHSPLNEDQQKTVVEVVRRELLTPYGLRSLAMSDPKFQARYTGTQFDRDKAYHNGSIWPWLIGAFLDAHLRVNHRSRHAVEQARRWLQPLVDSLEDGCLGQISEIYEAQPPHRPVGAFAQAWSVAEVLRLAIELEM
jgi:predicted glycogen debranching enzyme